MHSLKPSLQTLVASRVSAKKRNSSGLCANGLILQSLVSLPMKRGEAVQTNQQLQFSFHANIDSCKFFSYSHPPTLSLSLSVEGVGAGVRRPAQLLNDSLDLFSMNVTVHCKIVAKHIRREFAKVQKTFYQLFSSNEISCLTIF